MIGENDPHKIALLIMQRRKDGKGESAETGDAEPDPSDSDEDKEIGGAGPDALKGMFDAMKQGDYAGAFDALRTAVEACRGDD